MTKTAFLQAIAHIDEDILEKAIQARTAPVGKPRRRWIPMVAVAACVVLVGSLVLVNTLKNRVPVYEDTHYTAQQIAGNFDSSYRGDGTSRYTEVFVPNGEALKVAPLPEEEYLPIYESREVDIPLDEEELRDFADDFWPRLFGALDKAAPDYDPDVTDSAILGEHLDATVSTDDYFLFLKQYGERNHITVGNDYESLFTLDGETVSVQPALSDEELIASLSGVRDRLFHIFDVEFDSVKVSRLYDDLHDIPVEWIEVYFYDSDGHPLNDERDVIPLSDFICLQFSYEWHGSYYVVDETGDMTSVRLEYAHQRVSPEKSYPLVAKSKKISLAEAEALLEQGFVFGGHGCPFCMAQQQKVDFSTYDYVEIRYMGIPYYTFYKHIGTAENGNMTFAKTYVPAIPIDGIEEYLNSLTDKHNVHR